MVKKILLSTLLAMSTFYVVAQGSLNEQRRLRQQQPVPAQQEVVTPQPASSYVPTVPKVEEEKSLESIIDLGRISIGDRITGFNIQVDEKDGVLIKTPRSLVYEGKKIGELIYNEGGIWQFNGVLEDLALGDNYLKTTFVNEIGLSTNVSIKINTTNKPPVPGSLNYVFSSKSGETLEGQIDPTLVEGNYIYNVGEVHGRFYLSSLGLTATDEDKNLVKENIFVETNGVVVGSFDHVSEDNFSYIREDPQNRGLGSYFTKFYLFDKVGASTPIQVVYKKTGEPPKVLGVGIKTEMGVESNYDANPVQEETKSSGRNK